MIIFRILNKILLSFGGCIFVLTIFNLDILHSEILSRSRPEPENCWCFWLFSCWGPAEHLWPQVDRASPSSPSLWTPSLCQQDFYPAHDTHGTASDRFCPFSLQILAEVVGFLTTSASIWTTGTATRKDTTHLRGRFELQAEIWQAGNGHDKNHKTRNDDWQNKPEPQTQRPIRAALRWSKAVLDLSGFGLVLHVFTKFSPKIGRLAGWVGGGSDAKR